MNTYANCFTVRRHGDVSEGIAVSRNAQEQTSLMVDTFWINNDHFHGAVVDTTDTQPMVYRAVLHENGGNGKRKFFTLREPKSTVPSTLLIKAHLGLPLHGVVKVHGYEIHAFVGTRGTGRLVKHKAQEALVSLDDGEEMSFFFVDGWVRTLKNREGSVCDIMLSAEEMLAKRIAVAFDELACARIYFDPVLREKQIRSILSGVADLMHLMGRYGGQNLRIALIRDFFYKIEKAEFALVHRKLSAILHSVDSALVPMLTHECYAADAEPTKAAVVSINNRVDQMRRANERAERDRNIRNAMKGNGGSKPQQSSGKKARK